MDITAASIFANSMPHAATGSNGFSASGFGSGLSAQRTFADTLGAARHAEGLEAREGRSDAVRAREAAEKLISTTLVEPVLKQLRESNNAAAPFAPTQGEKQFGALLDHRLAHDIVRSANFPMVDRLARNLLKTSSEPANAPALPVPPATPRTP